MRGHGHPHILAYLYAKLHVVDVEHKVGTEGALLTCKAYHTVTNTETRYPPAELRELAIVGYVRLGHYTPQLSLTKYRAAVVEAVGIYHGETYDTHCGDVRRLFHKPGQGTLRVLEQLLLKYHIAAGVAHERELGHNHNLDTLLEGVLHNLESTLGIASGIGNVYSRYRRRNSHISILVVHFSNQLGVCNEE